MPKRERNEFYKTKSIGYRGEALNSLCMSSRVVITTKHADEPTGLKVEYDHKGDIASLEPVDMASPGTLVEVRDCFKNNEAYARKYRQNIKTQFEHSMQILTSYSLILSNTVFHVTNGFSSGVDYCPSIGACGEVISSEDCFATEDLTTVFTTTAPGGWHRNVTAILSKCFKKAFPRMTEWLVEFSTEFCGGAI